jgi:alpha-1,6-mannosyltransferase
MKIVDVSEFYAEGGGGISTYTQEKLRVARQLGHEVVVIAPGPRDDERDYGKGCRIIWVKSNPDSLDPVYYLLRNEKAVHEIIDREHPDVVEGSSSWDGARIAARWPGRALKVQIFHGDDVAAYAHTFLSPILNADQVDRLCFPFWMYLRRLSHQFDFTTVSGAWLERRLKRFNVPRVKTVPFGIDKEYFSPINHDPAVRKSLLADCGLPEQASLLIALSRHHPEKRLGTLIKAVKRLHKNQNVGLVIFGDGPFRPLLEWHVRKTPNIKLAGFIDDRQYLAKVIASADAFVHGSSAETYGLAVGEAVCSGTPIVVPNQGGAFDLAHPSYAEIYPPGDVRACATAIHRLLSRDRTVLQAACTEAARHQISSVDQHFESLFKLYEQSIGH